MPIKIPPIIQPPELVALTQTQPVILIDAGAGPGADEKYLERHLTGASYVNLNIHLAEIPKDAANGGRHPLPAIKKFAEVLGSLGISAQSHVVIYDDKNGANAAARFWWMLRAVGHTKVQVLNGGMAAAIKAGFTMGTGKELAKFGESYSVSQWQLPTVTIDETEQAANADDYIVIDVRDANRYNGLTEPIDLAAGHIPGAINIPFTTNLDADGLFLSAIALKEKYEAALENTNPENVIVYCGSGVTACHTLLAIDYTGLGIPKLYVGSWSEWSRNSRKVVP